MWRSRTSPPQRCLFAMFREVCPFSWVLQFYKRFDINSDGLVEYTEFVSVLESLDLGLSRAQVRAPYPPSPSPCPCPSPSPSPSLLPSFPSHVWWDCSVCTTSVGAQSISYAPVSGFVLCVVSDLRVDGQHRREQGRMHQL